MKITIKNIGEGVGIQRRDGRFRFCFPVSWYRRQMKEEREA